MNEWMVGWVIGRSGLIARFGLGGKRGVIGACLPAVQPRKGPYMPLLFGGGGRGGRAGGRASNLTPKRPMLFILPLVSCRAGGPNVLDRRCVQKNGDFVGACRSAVAKPIHLHENAAATAIEKKLSCAPDDDPRSSTKTGAELFNHVTQSV